MNINLNTPIWQLTVGELVEVIKNELQPKTEPFQQSCTDKNFVYGLQGLADLLGCSKQHAWFIKSTGVFDNAIIQRGRKIIINKEKVFEILEQKMKKNKK
jgi:hypothetical protein